MRPKATAEELDAILNAEGPMVRVMPDGSCVPAEMNEAMSPSYEETTHAEIIQAAARVIVNAVTDLIQADPHQWSKRPCATCAAVSTLLGKPFGCQTKAVIEKIPPPG